MGRRSRKSKRRMNSLFMALLLTALLLIMSTYAWFSANREVSIENITAKVTAAEGLQISLDGLKWGSSVSVTPTENSVNGTLATVGASVNKYVYPDELRPVSTGGQLKGAELQFFEGKVNSDGDTLTGTKDVTQETYGDAQASTGKYIVFDVFLKNSSSQTDGDELLLNSGSKAVLGATAPKTGVADTGLENSVRIGFALYPQNTAVAFSASQSDIAAITGTPQIAIWEPNYNAHIGEISANDSTRVKGSNTTFITNGLLSAGTAETVTDINAYGVARTGTETPATGSTMTKFSTIRTAGTLAKKYYLTDVTGNVAIDSTTTNDTVTAAGQKLKIAANKISKLRVYIWLEGQDPDCIDTASTGKYLDFLINLAKPAVGTTEEILTSVDTTP